MLTVTDVMLRGTTVNSALYEEPEKWIVTEYAAAGGETSRTVPFAGVTMSDRANVCVVKIEPFELLQSFI